MSSSGCEHTLPDTGLASCYVCQSEVNCRQAKHTVTPLVVLLAKIAGQNEPLDNAQPLPSRALIICDDCFWKINKYDMAGQTSDMIADELRPLMRPSNVDASADQPSAMQVCNDNRAAGATASSCGSERPLQPYKRPKRSPNNAVVTCYVCQSQINCCHFVRSTEHTRTPIVDVLAKIAGQNDAACDNGHPVDGRMICENCIRLIDKYDLACMISGNIANELGPLMWSSNDARADQLSAMEIVEVAEVVEVVEVTDANNVSGGNRAAEVNSNESSASNANQQSPDYNTDAENGAWRALAWVAAVVAAADQAESLIEVIPEPIAVSLCSYFNDDCRLHIFRYLKLTDLLSLSKVCTQLHALVVPLISKRCESMDLGKQLGRNRCFYSSRSECFQFLNNFGPYIRRLTIDGKNMSLVRRSGYTALSIMEHVYRRCGSLQYLILKSLVLREYHADKSDYPLVQLKELTLNGCDINDRYLINKFGRNSVLSMLDVTFDGRYNRLSGAYFPYLRQLKWFSSHNDWPTESGPVVDTLLAANTTTISTIICQGRLSLTRFKPFTNLQTLNTDCRFRIDFWTVSNLTSLTIGINAADEDYWSQFLHYLAEHNTVLNYLRVTLNGNRNPGLRAEAKEQILKLTTLRIFGFDLYFLDEEFLLQCARNLENLHLCQISFEADHNGGSAANIQRFMSEFLAYASPRLHELKIFVKCQLAEAQYVALSRVGRQNRRLITSGLNVYFYDTAGQRIITFD